MASTTTATARARSDTTAVSTTTVVFTDSDPTLTCYATVAWKMPAAFQTTSNVPAEEDWLAPKST